MNQDDLRSAVCGKSNECSIQSVVQVGTFNQSDDVVLVSTDTNAHLFWVVLLRRGAVVRKQWIGRQFSYEDERVVLKGESLIVDSPPCAMYGSNYVVEVRLPGFELMRDSYSSKGYSWKWDWSRFAGRGIGHYPPSDFVLIPAITLESIDLERVALGRCSADMVKVVPSAEPNHPIQSGPAIKALFVRPGTIILNVDGQNAVASSEKTPVIQIENHSFRENMPVQFRVSDGAILQPQSGSVPDIGMATIQNPGGHKIIVFKITYPLSDRFPIHHVIQFRIQYGIATKETVEWLSAGVGQTFPIDSQRATCRAVNGSIEPGIQQSLDENSPLFKPTGECSSSGR